MCTRRDERSMSVMTITGASQVVRVDDNRTYGTNGSDINHCIE